MSAKPLRPFKLPHMPVYTSDFFASTEDMRPEAAKTYLFLLLRAWERGGRLDNDDHKLARMARMSLKAWQGVRGEVLAKFEMGDDGCWHQARLTYEYERASRRAEDNRKNGGAGGRAKAAKNANRFNADDLANAIPRARVSDPDPDPQPEDSVTRTDSVTPNELGRTPNRKKRGSPIGESSSEVDDAQQTAGLFGSLEVNGKGLTISDACRQAAAIWNDVCGDLLRCVTLPLQEHRLRYLRPRLRDDLEMDLDRWRQFCERVRSSKFLTGQGKPRSGEDRPFAASFDWCIKASNFTKITEGNYDDRKFRPETDEEFARRIADRIAAKHFPPQGVH